VVQEIALLATGWVHRYDMYTLTRIVKFPLVWMRTVAEAEPPGGIVPNASAVEEHDKSPLNVGIIHVIEEALLSTRTPRE
jgi:hypothetical protein